MSFVRVPPDGVGKKLHTIQHTIGADDVHGQVIHVADPNFATNRLAIDGYGAASITFPRGALDAHSNLRIAEQHVIGGYEHTLGPQDDLFTIEELNGGSSAYNADESSMVLSVTTASGSISRRTTNRYHYYLPGVGTLITSTMQCGDSGKANNVRRWGYYDDEDGLFWELNGTTLRVVTRSSTSGSPVDTAVAQVNWNGDRLDGTGTSGLDVDITKINYYWIDFSWSGAGIVRFGVLAGDGSRVVCHTFQNPNQHTSPYMRTATLPYRMENFNTAGTAGSSELKCICGSVFSESHPDYTFWRFSDADVSDKTVTTNTPIISVRSKLLNPAGKANRVTVYPETLSIFVSGGDVKVTLLQSPGALTAPSWANSSDSSLQIDTAASGYTLGEGYAFVSTYLAAGSHNWDLTEFYETNDEGIMLNSDGITQPITSFVVTKLSGATVKVWATLTYRELR